MMLDIMKRFRELVGQVEKVAGMENETHPLKMQVTASCRINLEAMALEDGCSVAKIISKAFATCYVLRDAKADGGVLVIRNGEVEKELVIE